jgi:hypothetical protein
MLVTNGFGIDDKPPNHWAPKLGNSLISIDKTKRARLSFM